MTTRDIAASLHRAQTVFQRRPEMGLHDDAPATALWQGGTRVATRHGNGTEVSSDMPAELGGSGDRITPGWLFRAGLASCAATTIALAAIEQGIALSHLEVLATQPQRHARPARHGRPGRRAHRRGAAATCSCWCGSPRRVSRRSDCASWSREGCCRSPVPSAVQGALALDVQVEDIGA